MNVKALGFAALAAGLIAAPAFAHHSFAMFDHDHQVRMTGKVKDFRWQNPHVYIELTAPDAKGETRNWTIENEVFLNPERSDKSTQ